MLGAADPRLSSWAKHCPKSPASTWCPWRWMQLSQTSKSRCHLLPQRRLGWSEPKRRTLSHVPNALGQIVREVAFEGLRGIEELGSYQPSSELRDVIQAQFQFLFTYSCLAGPQPLPCRVTVYARCADVCEAPDLQLQRVATWPSRTSRPTWMTASALASSSQEEEDLLILRSSMGPGGAAGGAVDAEQSLVQEEVVLLPNSNTLVLPLADRGVLMGLMVVEGGEASRSSSSTGVTSSWSEDGADELDDYASSNTSSSGSSSSRTPGAVVGLSEEQLSCLRGAVPMLARACALDLRCAWEGLAAAARQARAASLLLEARGPLRAISTFGRMLMPRLPEGEPDRDMADAIMLQEQRLQEVVAQLEAALRPAAAPAGAWQQLEPLGFKGPPALEARGLLGWGGGYGESYGELEGLSSQEQKLLLPGGRGSSGEQRDGGISIDNSTSSSNSSNKSRVDVTLGSSTGLELQYNAGSDPWDLSSSGTSSNAEVYAGEEHPQVSALTPAPALAASTPSSSPSAPVPTAAPDAVWPPELPDALRSSQRDIRWRPAKPAAAAATRQQRAESRGGQHGGQQVTDQEAAAAGSYQSHKGVVITAATPPAPRAGADPANPLLLSESSLEDDAGWVAGAGSAGGFSTTSSSSGGGAVAAAAGGAPGQGSTAGHSSPASDSSPPVCNLVEVLANVLRAAGRLAQLQGVTLIVNHPLQVPADKHTSKDSTKDNRARKQVTRNSQGGSSAPASDSRTSELLPRPVPPLLVGVQGGVVARVLGYVLDVALQCTPRGGQLCVTARQCSGGVELCVLHTGQLQPSRLHPSSRGMTSALPPLRRARRPLDGNGRGGAGGAEIVEGLSLGGVGAGQGSGLVSLEFARQMIQRAGGRVSLVYPCHFMNAQSGQLELGTSVEVWLPRAEA